MQEYLNPCNSQCVPRHPKHRQQAQKLELRPIRRERLHLVAYKLTYKLFDIHIGFYLGDRVALVTSWLLNKG